MSFDDPLPDWELGRCNRCGAEFTCRAGQYMPTDSLRVLLQGRLRLLSLILTVFFALSLPYQTLLFGVDLHFVWSALLPQCAILVTLAPNAGLLRITRPRSLGWLRANELICFGVLSIAFAWVQYKLLGGLSVYARRGPLDLFIFAAAWDFTWFVLMVTYGLFIPNTRRRCAAIVGVLAVIPFAMVAAVALTDHAVEGAVLGQFLFAVSIHVTLGAAFAIFAARRNEVLSVTPTREILGPSYSSRQAP
jgi:hypothetical protein